jgi:hypothetical protein
MDKRGRKPKPVEQKQRLGNLGKRALPQLAVITPTNTEPPIPHRFLIHRENGEEGPGTRLWRDIWTSGAGWLRYETDAEIVMMVCEQTDERALLRMKLLKDGDWRDRAQLRSLEKLIAQNLSALGFTPTDRARLGGSSAPANELDKFRQKVANKRDSA